MNNTDTKIIKVHGKNIDNFFQNIITNDIKNLNTENPIYTAMLSPQGKYLYDFFIVLAGCIHGERSLHRISHTVDISSLNKH